MLILNCISFQSGPFVHGMHYRYTLGMILSTEPRTIPNVLFKDFTLISSWHSRSERIEKKTHDNFMSGINECIQGILKEA